MTTRIARVAEIYGRRLDRAERRLAQAIHHERECQRVSGERRLAVQTQRVRIETADVRLWDDLMGRYCGRADIEKINARLAHMRDVLTEMREHLVEAERAEKLAERDTVEKRGVRNVTSRRIEKAKHMLETERGRAEARALSLADDEIDELTRRGAEVTLGEPLGRDH